MSAYSRLLGHMALLGLGGEYIDGNYKLPNSVTRSRLRGGLPVFRKCSSCGFEVVDYQLDENDVCTDCRKEDNMSKPTYKQSLIDEIMRRPNNPYERWELERLRHTCLSQILTDLNVLTLDKIPRMSETELQWYNEIQWT